MLVWAQAHCKAHYNITLKNDTRKNAWKEVEGLEVKVALPEVSRIQCLRGLYKLAIFKIFTCLILLRVLIGEHWFSDSNLPKYLWVFVKGEEVIIDDSQEDQMSYFLQDL